MECKAPGSEHKLFVILLITWPSLKAQKADVPAVRGGRGKEDRKVPKGIAISHSMSTLSSQPLPFPPPYLLLSLLNLQFCGPSSGFAKIWRCLSVKATSCDAGVWNFYGQESLGHGRWEGKRQNGNDKHFQNCPSPAQRPMRYIGALCRRPQNQPTRTAPLTDCPTQGTSPRVTEDFDFLKFSNIASELQLWTFCHNTFK